MKKTVTGYTDNQVVNFSVKTVRKQNIKAEEIIDFLHKHPDFFVQYPEIIRLLQLPHQSSGNVSSLLEYQADRFKRELLNLHESIDLLKKECTDNRELVKHINDLVLLVFNEKDIYHLHAILTKALKKYYSADTVYLYIFSRSAEFKNKPGLNFQNYNSRTGFMFTEIFHRGKPLCNSLQEEHINTLFGADGNVIKSTILVPLQQQDWYGLLVLGSKEFNCYSHGFELDLLAYLSGFISLTVNKLI